MSEFHGGRPEVGSSSTHLITGFPGFLGSGLLLRLLERDIDARAVCVVQARYLPRARARIDEMRLGFPHLARRVRLVEGDITVSGLGLGRELEAIASETAFIWHLAAVYDLSVTRELAFRVNVEGTQRLIDFATRCPDLRRFHHVSTCYVSGRYAGVFTEDDLEKGQAFNNSYEESKYRAEVNVRDAMKDGLPATVYRPSIVVGDSRTGETGKYDGPYFIIQWILRQPGTAVVPIVGDPDTTRVNLVPSNFVIDAMVHLSALPHSRGRTYQLADPAPLTVSELLEVLGHASGKRIRRLRVPKRGAKWAIDRVPGVYRLLKIPAASVDYFVHPTHYTVFQARSDLEGSRIEVPAFPSYAGRLVSFMRAHPEVGSSAMV